MATEKTPLYDIEAPPAYSGATRSSGGDRRQQGVLQKEMMIERRKLSQKDGQDRKSRPQHSVLYSMLRPHSHRWQSRVYKFIFQMLVFVSVTNFILESEKFFQECCTIYFNVFEAVVSVIFLVEYCLKVYTVPERRAHENSDPSESRTTFFCSGESLVDVLSFAPFFVEIILGVNPAKYEVLKMFRLIRLLKLPIVCESFRLVQRVVYYNYKILVSSFLVCFIMILMCSILLWYTRPPNDKKDNFHSILACMYLAILMLTGQGEPNGVMPWYTRVMICVTALFAIAQFAIPASMLTWGFEQEAEHNIVKTADREKKMAARVRKGMHIPESSSSSGESERLEEWEGYLEQVVGSGSESEKEDDQVKGAPSAEKLLSFDLSNINHDLTPMELKRAQRIFAKLDTDHDGLINEEKIRSITDSDQDAKDLLAELATVEVGGKKEVTLREFLLWLSRVKTKYHRYGDKIFMRLLNKIETMLLVKKKFSMTRTIATSKWQKAVGQRVDGQPVAAASPPDQLLQIAECFGALERTNEELRGSNAELRAKVKQLEDLKYEQGFSGS